MSRRVQAATGMGKKMLGRSWLDEETARPEIGIRDASR